MMIIWERGFHALGRQAKIAQWMGSIIPALSSISVVLKQQSVLPLGLTPGVLLAMSSTEKRPAHVETLPVQKHVAAPETSERSTIPYSISVVLPAYNEEAIIHKTITIVARALKNWTDDFEIIVVNDGSKDQTKDIVERLAQSDPRIRLFNHAVNQGYGSALVSGFSAIQKDLVFFMDSDGQFDIGDLASFFPLIEQYDAVFGYRNPRQDPWPRKVNAWGWKQLIGFLLGVRLRDIDCAFKLYHTDFFQTLNLETRGAMINAEIMYKFKCDGYTYTEVGVQHLPRQEGQATGANPRVILRALVELIKFAAKWKRAERIKRIAAPK
jgi:glycosyltransferase involved in cell wall biosynthesis